MFASIDNLRNRTNIVFLQSFCVECKVIWDEVGESGSKRDAMLLDIEHMCLDLYKKKVD